MIERESIGKRLAIERKRLGHTQSEFAKLCGIAGASQFLYEKGERAPNADYLIQAAKLGVNIQVVLGLSSADDKTSEQSTNKIRQLFVQTDNDCRDKNGNLLDLSIRAEYFEKLLANQNYELKDVI